jgi:hypothetical protein
LIRGVRRVLGDRIGGQNEMVENIKLKIIESHDEILDIIDRNIGTLVNFDWHADYPTYPDIVLDADIYSNTILNNYGSWLDQNWVPILISKGFMEKYVWLFPHECAKSEIKKFKSKKGDCEIYNIRFQGKAKIPYRYITICADFFGCKVPFNWSCNDKGELFANVIESLTARNVTMVISKSVKYVNYDVEKFLEEMKNEMLRKADVMEI